MTLMDRRMETWCSLLAQLVVSLRVLAVRAMRKLLRRDLSMIEVRRRLRASSSVKDASGEVQ
jgi:SOS response regulatory protein OraA/RecX